MSCRVRVEYRHLHRPIRGDDILATYPQAADVAIGDDTICVLERGFVACRSITPAIAPTP
jgi:hypothetical protein